MQAEFGCTDDGGGDGQPVAGLPHLEHVVALRGSRDGVQTWADFLRRGDDASLDRQVDARMGEVGMAFVVPTSSGAVTSDALVTWCRAHLANFKVPRYAEIVQELPVNALGKVTKHVLRQRAQETLQLS